MSKNSNDENKKVIHYTLTKAYKKIEASLKEQLEEKFLSREHYTDLINDYMAFWVMKQKLQDDIDERGVTVKYDNGGGQCGCKKNDSINEKIKVSNQMLIILDKLGIKPSIIDDESGMKKPSDDKHEEPDPL